MKRQFPNMLGENEETILKYILKAIWKEFMSVRKWRLKLIGTKKLQNCSYNVVGELQMYSIEETVFDFVTLSKQIPSIKKTNNINIFFLSDILLEIK